MKDAIVQEVLTWVNTPYHHHARVKNVGVDCAMLVVAVAYAVGLITKEEYDVVPSYDVSWHLHNDREKLLEILHDYKCIEKPVEAREPGDIITFKYGKATSHLGIMINDTQIVHARMDIGKVVINTLQAELDRRMTHCFEFPGVRNG
jgi:NlpC/P60 family putative phage cell wall peptidase